MAIGAMAVIGPRSLHTSMIAHVLTSQCDVVSTTILLTLFGEDAAWQGSQVQAERGITSHIPRGGCCCKWHAHACRRGATHKGQGGSTPCGQFPKQRHAKAHITSNKGDEGNWSHLVVVAGAGGIRGRRRHDRQRTVVEVHFAFTCTCI